MLTLQDLCNKKNIILTSSIKAKIKNVLLWQQLIQTSKQGEQQEREQSIVQSDIIWFHLPLNSYMHYEHPLQ